MSEELLLAEEISESGKSFLNGLYKFTMQTDGNLVLKQNDETIWSSNTHGNMPDNLSGLGGERLRPHVSQNFMLGGEKLMAGQSLVNGIYRLTMHTHGNLVLQRNTDTIWSSNTHGIRSGCELAMHTNGNLVIYNTLGNAIWSSGTWIRNGMHVLVLQHDGNLVIFRNLAWSTNTGT